MDPNTQWVAQNTGAGQTYPAEYPMPAQGYPAANNPQDPNAAYAQAAAYGANPAQMQAYAQPAAQGYPAQPAMAAPSYPQQPPMPQQPYVQQAAPQPGGPTAATTPQQTSNANSTQNTLQIAEIRDGIVIMNDGSFRSVVMVKSINFDLMSQQEQEAVEYSYQGFLNSLYFPIQIFVRSQQIDLRPYIEKLDKIRSEHDNMLLALLMEDYINFMDQLSVQTNLMDKRFYVVIPYFPVLNPQKALSQSKNFFSGVVQLLSNREDRVVINEADLQKAKDELRNRVQAILGGLLQCGIQGLPLDTQELIELYYDTYNPDTATRQQLRNFGDLQADIITKGQGTAPQPNLQGGLQ